MTSSEANIQALVRLSTLLRRRFGGDARRDFVLLAARSGKARANTDDLQTQPMTVMREIS